MYAAGMMLFLVESSVGPVLWSKMFTVFDKLQDHSQYTGAHRHRFDAATGQVSKQAA